MSIGKELPSVKLGKERDKKIMQLIEETGPYSREQIQWIMFPTHKWPQKCRQRLSILVQRKQLKRLRFGDWDDYVYYTGSWHQNCEHILMSNWVYASLLYQRKNWHKVQAFHRDYTCRWEDSKLIADILFVIKNTVKGELVPVFVEVDRRKDRFDKVPKYTAYFESNAWTDEWWARPDKDGIYQFPRILVVTTRPNIVKKTVTEENNKKLRFTVATIDDIKKDIYRHI